MQMLLSHLSMIRHKRECSPVLARVCESTVCDVHTHTHTHTHTHVHRRFTWVKNNKNNNVLIIFYRASKNLNCSDWANSLDILKRTGKCDIHYNRFMFILSLNLKLLHFLKPNKCSNW